VGGRATPLFRLLRLWLALAGPQVPHQLNPALEVVVRNRVASVTVHPGQLCLATVGNCWMIASVSSLAQHPALVDRVVPGDQGFSTEEGYCGAFHFNFWVFGDWKEIIIDDRLPTKNGSLVSMHSSEPNEFWTALLEKAYAKYEFTPRTCIVKSLDLTFSDSYSCCIFSCRPVSHSRFSPTPADSVLSRRQPTHIG